MAKAKLWDEEHGTYKIKCPAGHDHYINTKVPNHKNAQWNFNGNLDSPTFTPSINERTGYYVNPEMYADAKNESYHCHFVVTDGKIYFCGDCSHELKGQTLDLPEID
jgi:hypothetical protein